MFAVYQKELSMRRKQSKIFELTKPARQYNKQYIL